MKIAVHATRSIEWQMRWARHASKGLTKHGHEVIITPSNRPVKCDMAVVMGPNAYQAIEKSGKPFLMFNRKFVGNDPKVVHENCAVSWNGFNGKGVFCVKDIDPKRLERYVKPEEFLDWKRNGSDIILCEQTNMGRSKEFRDLNHFYNFVKKRHKVLFRKKPIGEGKLSYTKLLEQLEGAKAVVTLNSTISIEALLAGYPVVSFDKGDPAYPITGHNMDEIIYPDREPLFQYLAHCQWHETEVASGEFWDHIYPIQGKQLWEW